jgi:hypothetical protein
MADLYDSILQRPQVGFNAVRDGRRAPIFWYDIDLSTARSIAAGTAEILPLAGDSFYADLDPVNQGEAVVTFQDTNLTSHGAPIFVTRGHIVNVPFTKLLIENAAQPGKRLRFFYGVGLDFKPGSSSSVSVSGEVSVIDGGKSRTLAGQVFGMRSFLPAVAGSLNGVMVWNQSTSGTNLIVKSYLSNVPASVGFMLASTAGWTPGSAPGGGASLIASKMAGGPAPFQVSLYYFQAPAMPGGVNIFGTALASVPMVEPEPIVIPPNSGFCMITDSLSTTAIFTAHVVQESI